MMLDVVIDNYQHRKKFFPRARSQNVFNQKELCSTILNFITLSDNFETFYGFAKIKDEMRVALSPAQYSFDPTEPSMNFKMTHKSALPGTAC